MKPGVKARFDAVCQSLDEACRRADRPRDSVRLIAVGKTFEAADVDAVYALGQRDFGENYVQEGVDKIAAFGELHPDAPGRWHFIGPLQSNKTRLVAENFDWVHSVDRLKIARRLSDQRPDGMPPINVLIQINIDREDTKSGILPDELPALAAAVDALPGVKLRGLMAIPARHDSPEARKAPLLAMKALFDDLKKTFPQVDTLSMGMTRDMTEAVACGATMVRVGRAIFGERDYPQPTD